MDPNETLRRIREIFALNASSSISDQKAFFTRLDELAELWSSLDKWLAMGGFHPNLTLVRNGKFYDGEVSIYRTYDK